RLPASRSAARFCSLPGPRSLHLQEGRGLRLSWNSTAPPKRSPRDSCIWEEASMSMDIAGSTDTTLEQRQESESTRLQAVRRRVLVVEDDPAQRELLVELLSGWGYDSVPVGSAEEAEFAVKRRGVDAAIVDVFLPGRSGAALMTKLRERFPDVLLIGIS